MSVDTRAYIFQMFTDIICCYMFFCSLENDRLKTKKVLYGGLCTPIMLIIYVYSDFSVFLLFSFILYFIFKSTQLDLKLANLLLFSDLIFLPVSFLSSAMVANFMRKDIQQGWQYVLLVLVIQATILWSISKFASKFINQLFAQTKYQLFGVIGQLVVLVILYFYTQYTHQFGIFDSFIWGTLSFVLIEFLILLGFFSYFYFQTRRKYESKLQRQQLNNLRVYTKQLEQSQLDLRKFRHDYKNMLLTLIELAHDDDIKSIIEYLNKLHDYSNLSLKQDIDRYQDIGNIKEPYVKSILLSKFFAMEQDNINFTFECQNVVKNIQINPVDMVRLLGILLDNAIEAVKNIKNKKIHVAIVKYGSDSIKIEVLNSSSTSKNTNQLHDLVQAGFSTKRTHSGLGLSIIDDIRKRNSNVFVKYTQNQNQFEVEVSIMNI